MGRTSKRIKRYKLVVIYVTEMHCTTQGIQSIFYNIYGMQSIKTSEHQVVHLKRK